LHRVGPKDCLKKHDRCTLGAHPIAPIGRKKGHVATSRYDLAHLFARRFTLHCNRSRGTQLDADGVWIEEIDCHFTVHDESELVMRGNSPGRNTFGSNGLNHVLHVLRNRDLLPGLGFTGHFEKVGEDVVLRLVIDNFDATFLKVG